MTTTRLCSFWILIAIFFSCCASSVQPRAETEAPELETEVVWAAAPAKTSAVLTWTAPTTNTDGSPLVDLAGYTIYYGRSSGQLKKLRSLPLDSEDLDCREVPRGKAGKKPRTECSYAVRNLRKGPHFFMVRAYNKAGRESLDSNVAKK